MTGPDANWQTVSKFMSDLKNASRLATYVDTVVNIFESNAWRRYTDANGRSDDWLECEFDYFLIACGASYSDVQRLLSWDRARSADLARAMESTEPAKRRDLVKASTAWQSPTGLSLTELALRQGWTKASGVLRVPPAPQRALARARHGMSADEHARRSREGRLPADRRLQLDKLASSVSEEVADNLELRYVIDALRDHATKGGGPGRAKPSAADIDRWRADVDRLGGDRDALAEAWGVDHTTVWRRLRLAQENH